MALLIFDFFSKKEKKETTPPLSEIDRLKGENKLYFNYLMTRFGEGVSFLNIPGAPREINDGNHTISKSGDRLGITYIDPQSSYKSATDCRLEIKDDNLVFSFYRTYNHTYESRGLNKRQQCAHEYPNLEQKNDPNNITSVRSVNYFLGRVVNDYILKVALSEEEGDYSQKSKKLSQILEQEVGIKKIF